MRKFSHLTLSQNETKIKKYGQDKSQKSGVR